MNQTLLIIQALGVVTSMIAPTLEVALRWKHLMELDPDVKVNVASLTGEAITVNQDTQQRVADWFKAKGISESGT